MNIADMKLRIESLEKRIEHQSKAYVEGYHQAMVDNGIVFSDVPLEELSDEYRSKLHSKATERYPKIK